MEVNVMPWNLAHALLGDVSLAPSDKLLKSCPFGHILKCRGVACAVPLTLDKIEVSLDFHIFDILDLDLLLGHPLAKLLDLYQGSLVEKLREATSATCFLENHSANLAFEPIPLDDVMHTFPFV